MIDRKAVISQKRCQSAFWALQADVLDKGRMDRMVAHLADTAEFDRPHRVPSLSADHPKYNPIFSHGHMVWLDTNLQQMLVDESLLNIGFYIERWQEIEDMEDEMKRLRAYVNEHLWDCLLYTSSMRAFTSSAGSASDVASFSRTA